MNAIRNALHSFWSSFTVAGQPIPAYQSGFAIIRNAQGQPIDAATNGYPRIVYDLPLGDFLTDTLLTANVWNRNTSAPENLGLLNNVLEQIMQAIPIAGADIEVQGGGRLSLWRSNLFIDYLSDPDITGIQRGIVRYIVRNRTNL